MCIRNKTKKTIRFMSKFGVTMIRKLKKMKKRKRSSSKESKSRRKRSKNKE